MADVDRKGQLMVTTLFRRLTDDEREELAGLLLTAANVSEIPTGSDGER